MKHAELSMNPYIAIFLSSPIAYLTFPLGFKFVGFDFFAVPNLIYTRRDTAISSQSAN